MALERRDPVPPGRYHVYISVGDAPRWNAWLKEHKGRVVVVSTEAQTELVDNNAFFSTSLFGETLTRHAGDWILFDVKSPVPWVNIGLPTIVRQDEMDKTRPNEFYKIPDPEPDSSVLDQLSKGAGEGIDTLITLVKVGVGLAAGLAVFNVVRGRKK